MLGLHDAFWDIGLVPQVCAELGDVVPFDGDQDRGLGYWNYRTQGLRRKENVEMRCIYIMVFRIF